MLSRLQVSRRRPAGHGVGVPGEGADAELERLVRKALEEWQAAQAHFDAVAGASDPDLVDHAIYLLEAARRKYTYLLKQVQKARGLPALPEEGTG